MTPFIVGIAWSQTDHENVFVTAKDRADAEQQVLIRFPGINHITGCQEVHHIIRGNS